MAAAKDERQELVNFIDQKAFDVILKTSIEKFDGQDRENLEGIQKKTKAKQHKFHEVYKTAKAVKENFLQNVRSKPAQKLNKELEHFKLPTMPEIKDEFLELCKKLGV